MIKMRYYRALILCLILFFQNQFSTVYAQCSLKVDYKIESKLESSSVINMKSLERPMDVKIQLYDLNLGKVVNEKEININNTYKVIFSDVTSSLYIFYIWIPACSKPLTVGGDKHGILIEN